MGGSGARILVTGGLGFVGAKLCEVLVERNFEVAVLDDLSVGSATNLSSEAAAEVHLIVGDIRDLESVAQHVRDIRPSVVVHLAAVHFIPTCERHPTRAIGVNVMGTQAMLEACALAGSVEAVVLASSGAVYAPSTSAHGEEASLGPTDVYGFSKEWTESLATYFHGATGVSVGIARLFNVVGPGETNPHLLPAIIEQLRSGAELHLGNLSTRRDYVYSGDIADGLARMVDWCRTNGSLTCNLGSESALSGAELVGLVARAAGRELPVTPDPARFRESDRPLLLSDCSRAHELLGWRAETTIEDAVAAALAQPFASGYARA